MSIFPFQDLKTIARELCTPDDRVDHVWDLDLETLLEEGFDTFVLDVDNTIVSHQQRLLSLRHLNWVQKCKDLGFKVYILSNNKSRRRIKKVCDQIQCTGYFSAFKPLVLDFDDLCLQFDLKLNKTIIVGDQVFTDVILGKWRKVYTVLVEPVDDNLTMFKRLQYDIEQSVLRYFEK